MSLTRILAISRTNLRLQLADIASPIVMTLVPLLLIPFLIPGAAAQLHQAGYPLATGAEQAVPGFAILFAFLSVQQFVTMFGREYSWNTWNRLRASPASNLELLLGKTMTLWLVQLIQLGVIVAVGAALLGYRPNGSVLGIVLTLLAFTVLLSCFSIMLVTVFNSMEHALVAASLGGIIMAGVGGAVAPVGSFPGWAADIARFSPAYWALDALRDLSLNGAEITDVLLPLAVLIAFAAGFLGITALRFRAGAVKIGTT